MEEAARLAESLERFLVLLKESGVGEEEVRRLSKPLIVPVCKMAHVVVEDMNKVGEYIHAAESDLSVCKSKHGADLVDDRTGDKMELKTVTYRKSKPKAVMTFSFPIGPATYSVERRRANMVAKCREKMAGLGVCLDVRDHMGKLIRQYHWSEQFCVAMFERIYIGERARTYGVSTEMCQSCMALHRIDKITHYSNLFDENGHLSSDEWARLFASTPRQCKGRGVSF